MMRLSRLCLFALLCCVLAACIRTPAPTFSAADPVYAEDIWERFTTKSQRMENLAGPFRANATLYYSGTEDSQRVTTYFWGNGQKNAPHPIRMDILMGPGSVMATAREDARGLFIYVPRDNLVYHAAPEEDGLASFGVPIPFTLADLSLLVAGQFALLFAPADGGAPSASVDAEGRLVYAVSHTRLPGSLTLDAGGLPVAWSDFSNTWKLTISYREDSVSTAPRRVHAQHVNGKQATLIVRELSRPETPYTPKQLYLAVPAGTRLAPLVNSQ